MSVPFPKRHLHMFVVYDKPKDYPDNVVVRGWLVGVDGTLTPRASCEVFTSLASARRWIGRAYPEMVMLARDPADDPCIAETWL